ncbi:hypothetical protein, partial [Companilactobacillus furfuricola]|uniref:hypothetical protein n=1 Tax=Companilactobacillus furfuricola TaxID=1462575 RepID=UPI001B86E256
KYLEYRVRPMLFFYTYNYIKKGVVSEPDGSNTTPFFGDLCHSLFFVTLKLATKLSRVSSDEGAKKEQRNAIKS